MDALSDILRSLRFDSSVYFRSGFCSPWGMEMDKQKVAEFHIVVRGHCWLYMDHFDEPMSLTGGDIVVFPLGDAHWIADDPAHERIPGKQVLEAIRNNEPVFQDGKNSTDLVCGHFEFDRDRRHPFIKALPALIHIEGAERHHMQWLETVTRVLIDETGTGRPGSGAIINRLAEVLFIQVIRTYIEKNNFERGFLAALANPQIGKALTLIHSEAGRDWTLEELARESGMSRSAFANTFRELVGMTPMAYLTERRMQKAKSYLAETNQSLLEVAEKSGYSSEAAFNRAFKRSIGQTPGQYRRSMGP